MTAAALAPLPEFPFDLDAIEARFQAGTITPADIAGLISELRRRPTVRETIALIREAEAEFDRLVAQGAQ